MQLPDRFRESLALCGSTFGFKEPENISGYRRKADGRSRIRRLDVLTTQKRASRQGLGRPVWGCYSV
jgi:hypothetical protein